ncbi:MAG TPA: hypothetical protein VFZ21_03320 [Gemmatimonadaceae bacterium]|nr:hypothetical protein [Gemmatimonadaceae bacterium]
MALLELGVLLWVIGLILVVALCRAAARGDVETSPGPDAHTLTHPPWRPDPDPEPHRFELEADLEEGRKT